MQDCIVRAVDYLMMRPVHARHVALPHLDKEFDRA